MRDHLKQRAGMPLWFKAFVIIAMVLLVGLVALHLAGGGLGGHHHGP